MKTVLIAVLMACAGTVQATPFDIGPNGTMYSRGYTFGGLDGVQMNGQAVSFDLNFNTSVHLFGATNTDFGIFLGFRTNGTTNAGFIGGHGFVLDNTGNQMFGVSPIGAGNSDDGALFVGLFPFVPEVAVERRVYIIGQPLDFYGVHFDLTLPDNGLFITSGGFGLQALDAPMPGNHGALYKPFRIGPHVPDNGSTFLLFGVGIVALFIGGFDRTVKQAVKEGN